MPGCQTSGAANAPPPVFFGSGAGFARIPFSLSAPKGEEMERQEAPGLARPHTDLTRVRLIAPTARPYWQGRRFGVRAANDVDRCASRGSTAMPLSGTAPCSVIRTPRSTTPSMSKAADTISAPEHAGISFSQESASGAAA